MTECTVEVHECRGCPFHRPPPRDTLGPAFHQCTHPLVEQRKWFVFLHEVGKFPPREIRPMTGMDTDQGCPLREHPVTIRGGA